MYAYAVDFDGTLCENAWPNIGAPNYAMLEYCINLRACGHKLILWTCRDGDSLREAIEWCSGYGLAFDAVNENLPERIALFGTDPRKVGADYYIDDKNHPIITATPQEEAFAFCDRPKPKEYCD
jgi:hypothetical protein